MDLTSDNPKKIPRLSPSERLELKIHIDYLLKHVKSVDASEAIAVLTENFHSKRSERDINA